VLFEEWLGYRSSIERIESVGLLQIEPWLLLVQTEQAVLDESAHDAGDDAIQELPQVLPVRRVNLMETRSVALQGVDAVQYDHVQVHVEVQGTTEALNEGHHTGSRLRRTGQSRALNQTGLNGPRDNSETTAEHVGPAGEEQAQGPGKAQLRCEDGYSSLKSGLTHCTT